MLSPREKRQRGIEMRRICSVIGINRTQWELRNMVKALSMCQWLNTDADCTRLAAAKWALSHWTEYLDECTRQRNAAHHTRMRAWRAQ